MNKSFRAKVKRAYEDIVEQREFKLPSESEVEEAMPLPIDFKEKIIEGVERDKRYVLIWGKRVSKVAIIILAIIFTGLTVYAALQTKFFYRIFKRNTEISTIDEEMKSGKPEIRDCYYPTYIGEFEVVETTMAELQVLTVYQNKKNETIIFLQQAIQTQYSYDNEYTNEERVNVNQVEAIEFSKHGETTLIWCEQGYLFELHAPDSYKDIVTKIAESIETD